MFSQAELPFYPGAVGIIGALADRHLSRDLFPGQTPAHHLQHLLLPEGQGLVGIFTKGLSPSSWSLCS